MSTRADRLWLFGGIVAVVLVVIAGWTLLISPKRAATDQVVSATEDKQVQMTKLRKEIAALKVESAKTGTYQAAQTTLLQALPTGMHMTTFLRQLQSSGLSMNVAVTNLSVGTATKSEKVPALFELPITATISGTAAELSRFLDWVQYVQPRALLLTQISFSGASPVGSAPTTGTTTTLTDSYEASLSMKAFVELKPGATTLTED